MKPIFLIVEDETITSRFIREIIEDQGYDVAGSAKSAAEARKLLAQHRIDIIIMDINIQGSEDGIQFARSLNEQTAIIYTSAYSDSQTLHEAAATMPYGILVKPFKDTDLIAALVLAVSRLKKEYPDAEKSCEKKKELTECWIDEENTRLHWYSQIIELSKNETCAMKLFLSKPDVPVTLEELRYAIWGEKSIGDSTIRELINRIRNKVDGLFIENIYGTGYILKK